MGGRSRRWSIFSQALSETRPAARGATEPILLGVCASLARAVAVPSAVVRALFAVSLVFFRFKALLAYVVLWAFLPGRGGEASPVDRGVRRVRAWWHDARRPAPARTVVTDAPAT